MHKVHSSQTWLLAAPVDRNHAFLGSPEPDLARGSSLELESCTLCSQEPVLARGSSGKPDLCLLVYRSQTWLLEAPINRNISLRFTGARPGPWQLR